MWYEALRWWEGLATRLGEKALSARIRTTAETIRGCFAELYLDRETGMIWDAVCVNDLSAGADLRRLVAYVRSTDRSGMNCFLTNNSGGSLGTSPRPISI